MTDASSYFFLTPGGKYLPRWLEAFPGAQVCTLTELNQIVPPALAWLRLSPGFSVADQLENVRVVMKNVPLVVLSDAPNDEEGVRALASGARGYCNTHAAPAVLCQVAAVVLTGGLWIGESLMERLTASIARAPKLLESQNQAFLGKLTERERDVAQAVANGASNKEIARQLGITERTIKGHVGAIFDKLGVRDRLHLALVVSGRNTLD